MQSENLMNVSRHVLQTPQGGCVATSCRAEKSFELPPKAMHFVQPRSEKFWNCDEKHCISFIHAAKVLEL
jgi:hypothetical protein